MTCPFCPTRGACLLCALRAPAEIAVSSSLRLAGEDPSGRVPAKTVDQDGGGERFTEAIHDRQGRELCPVCRRRVVGLLAHMRAKHPGTWVDLPRS